MLSRTVVYFTSQSYKDERITIKVLQLALARAKDLRIKRVVVPSSTGDTALKASEIFADSGIELVVVSDRAGVTFNRDSYETYANAQAHLSRDEVKTLMKVMGFHDTTEVKSGLNWTPEIVTKLRQKGVKVALASEPFRTMLRSRVHPTFVVAQTLNLFGRGVKVAVEVVLIACDAGFVDSGEEIIALGGLSKGVDTALVVKACHKDELFSETRQGLQVREIICKPRLR